MGAADRVFSKQFFGGRTDGIIGIAELQGV